MAAGGLLHGYTGQLGFLTPYLIFAMLFIPFCGVRPGELRITGLHISLLSFQAAACIIACVVAVLSGGDVSQGAMICLLAPTATSAVVIAQMLGARVSSVLTYSLLVNLAVSVGAPICFSIVAPSASVSFASSFAAIFLRVIPVIVLPFATALLLRRFVPRAADAVRRLEPLSFYLWLAALAIVTGRIVDFVATQRGLTLGKGLLLAGVALVVCLVQFFAGRCIGRRWGETVAGGQSLGQKNTILAIWLAQSYLDPVSSIAPAAYVLWQTLFNTIQLWLAGRRSAASDGRG